MNVGLYNTSGKTITNVKVSLASEDGTFVPFGSSNSFFVERIPAKGHYTKNVDLRVKPAAEQKTSAITVTMAYEDGAGGAYTATDIISIPVTQES
ncbi:MAG: S-layer protein, partial [Anaerovorax sp.]